MSISTYWSQKHVEVWECRFWMMHFGLPCPKPTRVMGNLSTMTGLNMGPLTKKEKEKNTKLKTSRNLATCQFQNQVQAKMKLEYWNRTSISLAPLLTAGKYHDSEGIPRFQGQKKALRASQQLVLQQRSDSIDDTKWILCSKTFFSYPACSPRAYTSKYGSRLRELYIQQLLLPAQRDLRVRVPVDYTLSDRELFFKMPTGDVWNDAGMKEVFEYLITSRHCRTVHVCCWGLLPLPHQEFLCFCCFGTLAPGSPLNGKNAWKHSGRTYTNQDDETHLK